MGGLSMKAGFFVAGLVLVALAAGAYFAFWS